MRARARLPVAGRAALLAAGVSLGAASAPHVERAGLTSPGAHVVGGAIVGLELEVGGTGAVSTRPSFGEGAFLDQLRADAATWSFARPPDVGHPLLVVGVYLPPEMILSSPLGPVPSGLETSEGVPAPQHAEVPRYPPDAVGAGGVLVEVEIDTAGAVTGTRTIFGSPPFTGEALDAARQWRFRPARVDGANVPSHAALAFVFRTPTVGQPPPHRGARARGAAPPPPDPGR